jgi:hypothetical protein
MNYATYLCASRKAHNRKYGVVFEHTMKLGVGGEVCKTFRNKSPAVGGVMDTQ